MEIQGQKRSIPFFKNGNVIFDISMFICIKDLFITNSTHYDSRSSKIKLRLPYYCLRACLNCCFLNF